MERTWRLPGSNVAWRFMVAQARASLYQQIAVIRSTLIKSVAILGLGLIIMATLQTFYGLRPLRSVRLEISRMRTGDKNRVTAPLPDEIMPMVEELNELLAHKDRKSVVSGTGVSVRVDFGGGRIIKKKKKKI